MRDRLFKTARFYAVYGSGGFSVGVAKSLGGIFLGECISIHASISS